MHKGQSNWRSFLEANMNTFIGLLLNLLLSPWVYTAVGMKYTWIQIGLTTLFFTIISIARGYVIRRFFNKHEKNKEQKLLDEIANLNFELNWKQSVIVSYKKLQDNNRGILSERTTELAELQEKYNILEAFYNASQADNLKLGEENDKLKEEVDLQVHNQNAFISDLNENTRQLDGN